VEVTKEIYAVENGFGYKVLQDGAPAIIQDCVPGAEGFVRMTEKQANDLADEIVKKIKEVLSSDGDQQ